MSLLQNPTSRLDHFSSKRKLDDYSSSTSAHPEFLSSSKLIRHVTVSQTPNPSHTNANGHRFIPTITELAMANSAAWKGNYINFLSPSRFTPSMTRFFVKLDGKSVNVSMDLCYTVLMLHEELQRLTGIRVMDQRLIFEGKQLAWDRRLEEYSVSRDSNLHLVSRMRSTCHPAAFQLTEDILYTIKIMCRSYYMPVKLLKQKVDEFIGAVTNRNLQHESYAGLVVGVGSELEHEVCLAKISEKAWVVDYLKVFLDYDGPKALVALYGSYAKEKQACAEECIRALVGLVHSIPQGHVKAFFALVMLEFCRLLSPVGREFGQEDLLYLYCRNILGALVKDVGLASGPDEVDRVNYFVTVQDVLPFLREVVVKLKRDMLLSVESKGSQGPGYGDVTDFSVLLHPLRSLVEDQIVLGGPIYEDGCDYSVLLNPLQSLVEDRILLEGPGKNSFRPCWDEILCLFWIFNDLCCSMDQCLEQIEKNASLTQNSERESFQAGFAYLLPLLKELSRIGKLYKGAENLFWNIMKCRKAAVHDLIVKFANHDGDYSWLFPHKNILHFESRSYLAMLMFPEVKEDYEELHEMLIDRSAMLSESFEYILNAEPSSLHAGLFIEFKNEEATGPGVMREWFLLVCQAIFNPDRALFVPCPLDRRRFFPNPASKVDQLHLDYFRFSGRVTALALMHKVQIGIFLDRVFFLQLAGGGASLSLDDIRDADPYMYNSCKQILEMDPDFIDSDALGLTFVREFELLGSRTVVELCSGGKQIIVTSKNRHTYVQLLVEHAFVISIADQVKHFTRGFTDIISGASIRRSFFQCLELEDLDRMLHGSGFTIPVEDWKLHTEYCGYKHYDPQISWFWEVIGEMSEDLRRALLFFWTSVKYLPIEGFRGLTSKLHIDKTYDSSNHLPSSHTCFFRLSLPPYPSKEVMRDRLHVITKEHVSSSFGTW